MQHNAHHMGEIYVAVFKLLGVLSETTFFTKASFSCGGQQPVFLLRIASSTQCSLVGFVRGFIEDHLVKDNAGRVQYFLKKKYCIPCSTANEDHTPLQATVEQKGCDLRWLP